nr:hypothetical protein [Rickettsiales endosymbiont of Stachyamoeba lipophora]
MQKIIEILVIKVDLPIKNKDHIL